MILKDDDENMILNVWFYILFKLLYVNIYVENWLGIVMQNSFCLYTIAARNSEI